MIGMCRELIIWNGTVVGTMASMKSTALGAAIVLMIDFTFFIGDTRRVFSPVMEVKVVVAELAWFVWLEEGLFAQETG